MIFAIEANENQLNQLKSEPHYLKIMKDNPNAIIVLCQNDTVRILHDASSRDLNLTTRGN